MKVVDDNIIEGITRYEDRQTNVLLEIAIQLERIADYLERIEKGKATIFTTKV